MIFSHIVKQLISCLLLSMLLAQSVLAGIVIPMELDNNEHLVNNHSIENHCTYDVNTLDFDKKILIDSEVNTHQCHHHTTLLFLFNYSRLTVSFTHEQVIFKNNSNFNSNSLEPPFKPPIIL